MCGSGRARRKIASIYLYWGGFIFRQLRCSRHESVQDLLAVFSELVFADAVHRA